MFLLSWATALGSTIRVGSDSLLAYLVSVAYPISDLVLLTMTIVVVARSRHAIRSGLMILALGLASLCIADSGFAYLTATGRYPDRVARRRRLGRRVPAHRRRGFVHLG